MPSADIVFIHPPSVYDFRKRAINYGLISYTVDSSSIFEWFPIGFLSLAHSLTSSGYRCMIVNLGARMLLDNDFNVEEFLKGISAKCFGIGLHWLNHAQGAVEISGILKRLHPNVPIVVGGVTASYYHDEIIKYPYIDFVIRGDSAEVPLLKLLDYFENKVSLESVPNLTWKKNNIIKINPLSHQPRLLEIQYDYEMLQRCTLGEDELENRLFNSKGQGNSFSPVIPFVRGCQNRCITCGGSNFALQRECLGVRPASSIVRDIESAQRLQPKDIVVYGDIRQGEWESYLDLLASQHAGSGLRYEFQWPASLPFLKKLAAASPHFKVMMSPETHDEKIRTIMGRKYSNEQLENTIQNILQVEGTILLFFMLGLPHQDHHSVYATLNYMEYLMDKYNGIHPGVLDVHIGPLAPNIDPGSPAFANPEAYGYKLRFRSLAEHISASSASDWREMFNYESLVLDRFALADISWEAALRVLELWKKHKLIQEKAAGELSKWLSQGSENDRKTKSYDFFWR